MRFTSNTSLLKINNISMTYFCASNFKAALPNSSQILLPKQISICEKNSSIFICLNQRAAAKWRAATASAYPVPSFCLTMGSLLYVSPCPGSACARPVPVPRHPHRQDISLQHTQLAWPLSVALLSLYAYVWVAWPCTLRP